MSKKACIPAAGLHAFKTALWADKVISGLLLVTAVAKPTGASRHHQTALAVLPFSCLLAVAGFAVAV